MPFNSAVFVFVFLPCTLLGYYLLHGQRLERWAIAWLVFASAVFYGWFSIRYLAMLALLILVNYAFGIILSRDYRAKRQRLSTLVLGIGINLAVLVYFKYTNFLIGNVNTVFGTSFVLHNIILPIGISFFTFQKIAYLVDAYRGEAEEYNLLDFSLFVMFFPQLIAGPIVHHREIIPQFRRRVSQQSEALNLAAGLALFTIGLVKKAVFADTLVGWSDPVFASAQAGHLPTFFQAWIAVLSFTLQIYFDFSGYTDMALGLALMVGIRLPLNFDSPYKARNIIEFWRCWHMTLSRFLRDYVYIPLGGNRRGPRRRTINLMLTMLIGGLWHGAAWTFVVWGGLHGLYLVINHAWHRVGQVIRLPWRGSAGGAWTARTITFLAVVVAWVFFRSESFGGAVTMFRGMAGMGGFSLPTEVPDLVRRIDSLLRMASISFDPRGVRVMGIAWQSGFLAVLLAATWLLPNSQQLMAALRPALQDVRSSALGRRIGQMLVGRLFFSPDGSIRLGAATGTLFAGVVLAAMILQSLHATSLKPFIYFQF